MLASLLISFLTSKAKYVYVYVRYLLEVFSRFEDPRARFGHRGMALISGRGAAEVTNQCPPKCQTKHEGFNLLKTDCWYLTYLESSSLPALRKQVGESR